MSYVQKVLQPNEEILKQAAAHWIAYFRGLLFTKIALIALIIGIVCQAPFNMLILIVVPPALIGLLFLFSTWVHIVTTEIAVTNKRILYKTGFIRRDTIEMNINQVDSVRVDQSILGRLLDFGTVTVSGTGQGIEPLQLVKDPLALRSAITSM